MNLRSTISHCYIQIYICFFSQKKQKKIVKKVNGFSDPFEENDDDVNRIAKEFERKYGTVCAGKKRSSNNNDCDKGAGYDLNDVFIDNSEAVSCFHCFDFISSMSTLLLCSTTS